MLMMMEWNWVWCYFCLARRKLEVPVEAMLESFGGEYYCLFGDDHIAVVLMHELGHLIRKPQKSICICVILAPTVALFQLKCWLFLLLLMTLLLSLWPVQLLSGQRGAFYRMYSN